MIMNCCFVINWSTIILLAKLMQNSLFNMCEDYWLFFGDVNLLNTFIYLIWEIQVSMIKLNIIAFLRITHFKWFLQKFSMGCYIIDVHIMTNSS